MKIRWLVVLIGLAVFGYVSSASALTLMTDIVEERAAVSEMNYVGPGGYVNSGDFIAAFEGNDSNQLPELQDWLITYGGYDSSLVLSESFNDEYGDSQATKSGTWDTGSVPIMFYAVKAADAFAIYSVNPMASSGTWSTYDLWIRGANGVGEGAGALVVSHINGYTGSAPVPEPATLLLMGAGLFGLAGMGRKKLKKQ